MSVSFPHGMDASAREFGAYSSEWSNNVRGVEWGDTHLPKPLSLKSLLGDLLAVPLLTQTSQQATEESRYKLPGGGQHSPVLTSGY